MIKLIVFDFSETLVYLPARIPRGYAPGMNGGETNFSWRGASAERRNTSRLRLGVVYSKQSDLEGFFGKLLEFGINITGEREAEYLFDLFPLFFSKADSWTGFSETLAAEFGIKLAKERKEELAKYLEKKLSFKLYDDVKEVIALPQRKAILTLASRFLVESIGDLAQFDIFTPREIRYAKPDKRAFLEVLKKMKTVPSEAIMVGDSFEKDIEPALALGMKGILIDREGKVSDNSIVKISSLKDLKQYL